MIVQDPPASAHRDQQMVFSPCPWTRPDRYVYTRGLSNSMPDVAASRLRIVVGTCLYGVAGVRFDGPDGPHRLDNVVGRAVDQVHLDEDLSLYELEVIARVAQYVGDLTAVMPASTPITVVVDVARLQYYATLLDGYAQGLVPADVLYQWWAHVDRRWAQLTTRLAGRVRRHTAMAGRPVRIVESPGLGPALAVLRDAVARGWPTGGGPDGQPALVRDLLDAMLRSSTGPEWATLLAHLPRPATVRDVALASYTWTLTRPALLPPAHRDRPTVTVMVDDASEHSMFRAADRLLSSLAAARVDVHSTPLVGLFPLRRVHFRDPQSLFWAALTNRFRSPDGTLITSHQLVDHLTMSASTLYARSLG
ncbi:hypothetical protein GCM10029964_093180 [Kibdelosporangium lantanae]